MKVKTCLIAVLLLLVSAAFCFGAAEEKKAKAPGGIIAPEPGFKFTGVLEGDEIVHDFIIRNTGTEEVRIKRVKTG